MLQKGEWCLKWYPTAMRDFDEDDFFLVDPRILNCIVVQFLVASPQGPHHSRGFV